MRIDTSDPKNIEIMGDYDRTQSTNKVASMHNISPGLVRVIVAAFEYEKQPKVVTKSDDEWEKIHYSRKVAEFWSKATKEENGCLEWNLGRDRAGYGVACWDGKHESSHRVAWKITHGEIPEGMHVCHHCDNPPCINPEHLFLGTAIDNMRDCAAKGRNNKGKKLDPKTCKLVKLGY